jgi:hypothetical protein
MTVVNIKDAPQGWRDNPRYMYIGRNHEGLRDRGFGNPHPVGYPCTAPACRVGTVHERGEAIGIFAEEFRDRVQRDAAYRARIEELRGKTLVCFCKPRPCHGDVYVEWLGEPVVAPRKEELPFGHRREGVLVYAGIGSRKTPPDVLAGMEKLGEVLCHQGWWLRTGNAPGADQAFARGAGKVDPGKVVLYLPWPRYEAGSVVPGNHVVSGPTDEAIGLAVDRFDWLRRVSQGVQKLQGRNMHQVYGTNLDWPVHMVLCWMPGEQATGGTGYAWTAAGWRRDVVRLNLWREEDADLALSWIARGEVELPV